MRRSIGSLAVLAVTSVVAACSATTSPLATLGLASGSPELFTTIPTTGGPPQALAPGTVASPSGFEPALTFQLPAGWYGHGNTKGLAIGTDLNLAAERFDGPSVSIDVVDMPMEEAVARFRAV